MHASANMYRVGVDSGDPDRVIPYLSASNTVDWSDANGGRISSTFFEVAGSVQHFTGKPAGKTYRVTRTHAPLHCNYLWPSARGHLGAFRAGAAYDRP